MTWLKTGQNQPNLFWITVAATVPQTCWSVQNSIWAKWETNEIQIFLNSHQISFASFDLVCCRIPENTTFVHYKRKETWNCQSSWFLQFISLKNVQLYPILKIHFILNVKMIVVMTTLGIQTQIITMDHLNMWRKTTRKQEQVRNSKELKGDHRG